MLKFVLMGLLSAEPRYGYELKAVFEQFLGGTWPLNIGQVYTGLAKLEEDGLVQSFWQSSQARGPARHMYELTEAGRADLVGCADDVRRLMSHLDEFLDRFASVDGSGPPPPPEEEEKSRRRFWRSR